LERGKVVGSMEKCAKCDKEIKLIQTSASIVLKFSDLRIQKGEKQLPLKCKYCKRRYCKSHQHPKKHDCVVEKEPVRVGVRIGENPGASFTVGLSDYEGQYSGKVWKGLFIRCLVLLMGARMIVSLV